MFSGLTVVTSFCFIALFYCLVLVFSTPPSSFNAFNRETWVVCLTTFLLSYRKFFHFLISNLSLISFHFQIINEWFSNFLKVPASISVWVVCLTKSKKHLRSKSLRSQDKKVVEHTTLSSKKNFILVSPGVDFFRSLSLGMELSLPRFVSFEFHLYTYRRTVLGSSVPCSQFRKSQSYNSGIQWELDFQRTVEWLESSRSRFKMM
jgi:hypothetical protein